MMWGYHDGWSGFAMTALMVSLWAATVILIGWAYRTFRTPASPLVPARDALRLRLAAGQISPEEFDSSMRTLEG